MERDNLIDHMPSIVINLAYRLQKRLITEDESKAAGKHQLYLIDKFSNDF